MEVKVIDNDVEKALKILEKQTFEKRLIQGIKSPPCL